MVNIRKYSDNYFPQSLWYRFTGYEIVRKTIRPRPGARLEAYRPWDIYRRTMGQRRTVDPPYTEFLQLGRWLEPRFGDVFPSTDIPPELKRAIERWCSRWGYPGVLPSTAVDIVLPKKVPPPEPEPPAAGRAPFRSHSPEDKNPPKPTQTRYLRYGGAWISQVTELIQGPGVEPLAVFRRWHTNEWEEEPTTRLGRYFPTVKFAQDFPLPGTPEFHELYAEPAIEFVITCVRFFQAARVVSRYLRGESPLMPNMRVPSEEFTLNEAMAQLTSLEQGIGPSYTLDKPRISVCNDSVSLLSSFAGMLLMDFTRERRMIECKRCGTVFVSDHERAKFCSRPCRQNEANTRFRATHKPAKTLRPRRKSADPDIITL